eukprot:2661508-Prorocentrum_lima.AAC.1
MLLLDWRQAFDKVRHEALSACLQRLGVPAQLLSAIKDLYKDPRFTVNINGSISNLERQTTGIRQGCPLSPYLFVAVMTELMAIVHADLHGDNAPPHCVPHTTYQEVYFADDTICFSGDARDLELLLHKIEEKSA